MRLSSPFATKALFPADIGAEIAKRSRTTGSPEEQQRSILGSENPATLATQQEAARVMANLGRYAESEIACREILAARLRVLGRNDLETLVTRHYLARAVGEQGRYEESATADAGLLEMSHQVVGDEHYFTLLIRKDLAAHLKIRGGVSKPSTTFARCCKTGLKCPITTTPMCWMPVMSWDEP